LVSGPLHRCVQADSRRLRLARVRRKARSWGYGFRLVLLAARGGASQRRRSRRRNLVGGEVGLFARCARVPFWLQKSARGVGLREAILVAAGVGDGGLAGLR